MRYTTLGRTNLPVSVAALGCGGFSRLGLEYGKSEREAADIIRAAIDHGVNYIDTAPVYRTEPVVGAALKEIPRDSVVVATKAHVQRNGEWVTPEGLVASVENSLRLMGTDTIDVIQLHGVRPDQYAYARDVLGPALLALKEQGKVRHLGLTEAIDDVTHAMAAAAAQDDLWDVFMVAFHMMHQNARQLLFPLTAQKRIGVLIMFAVRSIFARPERLVAEMRELAQAGKVPASLGESDDPLGFLLHEGGAASVTEAAYRYALHEPGVDAVLFGTGDIGHLKSNIASLMKPPLPEADRERLAELFGALVGVGLDAAPMQKR